MANVKAVLVDGEWFQVYDNQNKFTEKYVASGEYWNYFYNVWKTVSSSPFSNAIVFVADGANTVLPATIKVNVADVMTSDNATVLTLEVDDNTPAFVGGNVQFVQTEDATTNGVAIHKYGAVMYPSGVNEALTLELLVNGTKYTAGSTVSPATETGTTITFTKG